MKYISKEAIYTPVILSTIVSCCFIGCSTPEANGPKVAVVVAPAVPGPTLIEKKLEDWRDLRQNESEIWIYAQADKNTVEQLRIWKWTSNGAPPSNPASTKPEDELVFKHTTKISVPGRIVSITWEYKIDGKLVDVEVGGPVDPADRPTADGLNRDEFLFVSIENVNYNYTSLDGGSGGITFPLVAAWSNKFSKGIPQVLNMDVQDEHKNTAGVDKVREMMIPEMWPGQDGSDDELTKVKDRFKNYTLNFNMPKVVHAGRPPRGALNDKVTITPTWKSTIQIVSGSLSSHTESP